MPILHRVHAPSHPETLKLPRRVIDLLAAGATRLIDARWATVDDDIEHAGSFAARLELSQHGGLSVVPTGERNRCGTESGSPGTPEDAVTR